MEVREVMGCQTEAVYGRTVCCSRPTRVRNQGNQPLAIRQLKVNLQRYA